jgi:uncharacterized protein YejL (UPF0352 family)
VHAFIRELLALLELHCMSDLGLDQLSDLVLVSHSLGPYQRRQLLKSVAKVLPPKVRL